MFKKISDSKSFFVTLAKKFINASFYMFNEKIISVIFNIEELQ